MIVFNQNGLMRIYSSKYFKMKYNENTLLSIYFKQYLLGIFIFIFIFQLIVLVLNLIKYTDKPPTIFLYVINRYLFRINNKKSFKKFNSLFEADHIEPFVIVLLFFLSQYSIIVSSII